MSFWYNVDTGQVETDDNRSRGEQVLGPYATEAEAERRSTRPTRRPRPGTPPTAPGVRARRPVTRTSWTTDPRAAWRYDSKECSAAGKAPDSTSAA